ncbi:hypothetical protein CC86DRAFT_407862 [Ophiobolus disseminans]|uniref:Uncharacterized protein n=1 Tax=Ophiobolus disseminans TaxID=1469910 RepID=A0A6A6ZUG5_9PLEO|nr:hypothetical protein CC86DRAFT_407862 [Ophiobolus disseminans]
MHVCRGTAIDHNLHEIVLSVLLHVRNSEFAKLSLEVYYKSNTFSMSICDSNQMSPIKHPPTAYGSFIRRLEVTIENCVVGRTIQDLILTPGSGWGYLLSPTRPLRIHTHPPTIEGASHERKTDWQANFPNLRYSKTTNMDGKQVAHASESPTPPTLINL